MVGVGGAAIPGHPALPAVRARCFGGLGGGQVLAHLLGGVCLGAELVSVSRALVGGCGALLGLLRDYARSGRTVLYSSHVLGPCPATEISRCRAP